MSVLACDRVGCTSVLCDRCGNTDKWICEQCFEELVHLGPQTDLEAFMDGKPEETSNLTASRAYFEVIYPVRRRSL